MMKDQQNKKQRKSLKFRFGFNVKSVMLDRDKATLTEPCTIQPSL